MVQLAKFVIKWVPKGGALSIFISSPAILIHNSYMNISVDSTAKIKGVVACIGM